jgi:hypothetical protein
MTGLRRISIILAALLAAAASLPTKAAPLGRGNVFDGSWTLVVETKRGTCPAAVRADVRILGGQVLSTDPSYRIDGRVARNGAVQAQVAAAGQTGGAYGRLSGEAGQGSWRTSSGDCTGTWNAERRG